MDERQFFLVDSLGLYPPARLKVDVLLLTQSPRLHLGRYLDSVKPRQVIADGSNYPSFVNRWQQSCAKRKLPFHYTGEKGAYVFIEKVD